MEAVHDARLEAARSALRAGNGAAACAALGAHGEDSTLAGDVLEILARADYLDFEFGRAIERWERAYGAYRAAGDTTGAIRVARTLAGMYHSVRGQFAISSGSMAGRRRSSTRPTTPTSAGGWR